MDSRAKILIVEDEELSQKFYNIFLSKYFDVVICPSAETCENAIAVDDFDLILMDISLSGKKDGLQITRELRLINRYKNVPIIALTANVLRRDEEAAMAAGINLFLKKPIENHKLLEAINKFLNKEESSTLT